MMARNARSRWRGTGAHDARNAQQLQKIEAGEANIQMTTVAMLAVGLDVDAEELFREPEQKG